MPRTTVHLALPLLATLLALASTRPAGAHGEGDGRPTYPAEKSINTVLFSATGRLFLSVDGGGGTGSSYTIDVEKPSGGATVRKAFLLAASTGFTDHRIPNGGIQLNGSPVIWTSSLRNGIRSWNHEADVTALVAGALNGVPAGRTRFSVTESSSALVDGAVLAVIFDDSAQRADTTISLLFGAQSTTGDQFSIDRASSPGVRNSVFNMGLGISYGGQGPGARGVQASQITVNGQRLTSAAGGEDDGASANGALLTVGGLGDSTNNPPNPFAGPDRNPRSDDELYSLLPFITTATRRIQVDTLNPSNDDNIFFAYFVITGQASVAVGPCQPGPTTLCLDDQPDDERFRVEVSYSTTQGGGRSGDAGAISLKTLGVTQGGVFWFFSPTNPEMLVKVLNGCPVNNRFWVFVSAVTNVGYRVRVVDSETGRLFEATNRDGTIAPPVANTSALPCP
jgi:hypothetical protein